MRQNALEIGGVRDCSKCDGFAHRRAGARSCARSVP
jgi:hypothetical protein